MKILVKQLLTFFTLAVFLAILTGTAAAAPSFQGFETDTGDWVFDSASSGRVASGTNGVASASGSFHAKLFNVHDNYGGAVGYGTAGVSRFGGGDPVYAGPFYQAVDVYIDPTWTGLGFWIDMSPRDSVDNNSLWAAEGNFRLTGNGTSVSVQAINSSNLTTITTAGWYSFEIGWSKGTNPTDLINMDLSVYNSTNTLLGHESFLATFPQNTHPGQSQYLGNNSYVWFTVWENGFANDVIAIDNVRTYGRQAVPEPATMLLLGIGLVGLAGIRRKFRS